MTLKGVLSTHFLDPFHMSGMVHTMPMVAMEHELLCYKSSGIIIDLRGVTQ